MSTRRPFYAHGLFVTVHAPVPYSTPAKFWYRDRHIDAVQISVEHHEPAYWLRLASLEDETKEDVTDFKDWVHPSLDRSLKILRVAELKRQQADTGDTVASLAAARLLAHLVAFSSSYEPHDYLDQGDPLRALAMLAIAEAVRPRMSGVCYYRARALSMLGRNEDAVQAVECWARAVRPDADSVAANPELAALRDDPQFRALLTRLREEQRPPGAPQSP